MKTFFGYLRFVYVVCAVLWFSFKGLIGGLFTNREKFYRKRIGPDGRKILRRLGSTLEIRGLENLKANENYVLAGNHRSFTDILVIFLAIAAAGRDVIFMSKKEIFKVPLLGTAMRAIGMIEVERGDSAKAMRSMVAAVQAVKEGKNLVIFPEGTRSVDGQLGPFKRGGFIIASRAGVKIAPFVLKNTEIFMPKGRFALFPANVTIEFLPTIETASVKDTEAMNQTADAIRSRL